MSLYCFRSRSGEGDPHECRVDLPDLDAVRAELASRVHRRLSEDWGLFRSPDEWRVDVVDQADGRVMTLVVAGMVVSDV